MTIPNKLINLDEWASIRRLLQSKSQEASDLYRDYFFTRRGPKKGTGIANVTMVEALQVAEAVMDHLGLSV